jgi:predicted Zn finger-like uncharacterized protein
MNRMRIACPSCDAEYDVPDRLLAGAARTLRCSRCRADFALPQAAPPPAPEPPAVVAPTPTLLTPPMRERAPVASVPPTQAALLRAWIASLVVVTGAVAGLLVFRAEVMAAWPPAARMFAVLGLA